MCVQKKRCVSGPKTAAGRMCCVLAKVGNFLRELSVDDIVLRLLAKVLCKCLVMSTSCL